MIWLLPFFATELHQSPWPKHWCHISWRIIPSNSVTGSNRCSVMTFEINSVMLSHVWLEIFLSKSLSSIVMSKHQRWKGWGHGISPSVSPVGSYIGAVAGSSLPPRTLKYQCQDMPSHIRLIVMDSDGFVSIFEGKQISYPAPTSPMAQPQLSSCQPPCAIPCSRQGFWGDLVIMQSCNKLYYHDDSWYIGLTTNNFQVIRYGLQLVSD